MKENGHKCDSDIALLDDLNNHHHDAIISLFDQYYEKLYLFAEKFTYTADVADDIVQNVLLRVWEGNKSMQITTSFRSYLFTAVKNESLKYLRQLKIRDTNDRKWAEAYIESLNLSELDPSQRELLDKIYGIIDQLPDQCKAIYKLRMIYGYKYKEIADELNVSEDVVRVQIHRATKHIRGVFEALNSNGTIKDTMMLYLISVVLIEFLLKK